MMYKGINRKVVIYKVMIDYVFKINIVVFFYFVLERGWILVL